MNSYPSALGALFLSVVILAFQDVYLAVRLDTIHPAQLIVLMFSCVMALAVGGVVTFRHPWPKITGRVAGEFLLFNLSTCASWIGTFWALKNLQPTVVSALTLSVPPAFSVLYSIREQRGRLNRLVGTTMVAIGITLALLSETGFEIHLDPSTCMGLLAALLAALGVWGNAELSRRIARAGFTTNQAFCVRFILLITLAALHLFSGQHYRALSTPDMFVFSVVAAATFYLPMLLLYRSSIFLSVHSVTIGLALTPLATLALQSVSLLKVTPNEIIGMAILGLGVIVGVLNQQEGTP
jgi:drug/metabolite transporter (DMT)-like permease